MDNKESSMCGKGENAMAALPRRNAYKLTVTKGKKSETPSISKSKIIEYKEAVEKYKRVK